MSESRVQSSYSEKETQDPSRSSVQSSYESELATPAEIRKIEVVNAQYGVAGRVVVFIGMFLVAYTYGLDGSTRSVFQTTATNSYQSHSLVSTVNVVQSVIGAAAQPAIARLSDVFGRKELLIATILFYIVGGIIESQAYNVQRFAGGAILYKIGYTGIVIILEIILSDFSTLNWRLFASYIPVFPFVINTWISGNVTQALEQHWSWGIGMWCIIMPVVSIPLIVCLFHMEYRAKKKGELEQFKNLKTDIKHAGLLNYFKFLFFKLDLLGLVFMVAFLALILVPLTLAGGASKEWKTAKIIVPIIIGFLLIPVFVLWELKASYPLVPFSLLKNRGIWAGLGIGTMIQFVYLMQSDYMYTVLIVGVNQSVESATRITTLDTFVSTIAGTILGLVVAKVRRLKPFIVAGSVVWLTAMGMLIKFRGGLDSKAGIIGSLCFLGVGTGMFTYPTMASIQSCTKHEHMAVITALYLALYNIGAAFGSAVSGAMWTQVLPVELNKRLDNSTAVKQAYGSPFDFVKDYPWGSPERDAVVDAYRYIQRLLLIVGTCLTVPLIVFALLTKNNKLETKQSLDDDDDDL